MEPGLSITLPFVGAHVATGVVLLVGTRVAALREASRNCRETANARLRVPVCSLLGLAAG